MAQTTSLVFNGGSIPSPAPAPSGTGKAKLLRTGEITITEQGAQVTKKVICDPDSVTTVAPFMEVLTATKLAELVNANSILVLDDGTMQYLMSDAITTVEDETPVCTSVNFLGLSKENRAKVAYNCTRLTDELTLQQVVEVSEPVETNFNLVISDSEDENPNTLIDKMEIVDDYRDPEDPDQPQLLELEVTEDGQGNRKVGIREDILQSFVQDSVFYIDDLYDRIGELPSDEHGYFNSTLYTTPGDGTTTNLAIDDFRIANTRDVHGDSIDFVPTHQEGGVDYGEIYLEPGTYIVAVQVTLQWVGNPRGTFLPQVSNVCDQPFDFSYEHEDVVRLTRIVTRDTRGKFLLNIGLDADTPQMGIWIKSLEIAQVASYNHPAILHDTTLTGSGQIGDPLGVNTAVVAQSTLAGNIAPAFDSTKPNDAGGYAYYAGETVVYNGEHFVFRANHSSGIWNATEVVRLDMSSLVKPVDANDNSIWHRGGLLNTNGEAYRQHSNRLYSDLLPIVDEYTFALTAASSVTFSFFLYAYDNTGAFLGQLQTPAIVNIKASYPSAKFYRLCIANIAGVSLDTDSSISAVCTFNRPVACYAYYDLAIVNHINGRLLAESRCVVDLNDPLLWDCVGISGANGGYDFSSLDRLTSKLLAFTDDTSFVYTAKNGATFKIFVYTYDADGKFIRRTETDTIISARSASDGDNLYRISITNISVDFNDITDVVEFKQWSVDRNTGYFGAVQNDYSQDKFFNTCKLKQSANIPYISFCFDDVEDDADVVGLFRRKMLRCGFAFIATLNNLQTKRSYYSRLQKEGFDILNHSNSANAVTVANYPTYQEAFDAVYEAFDGLRKNGFVVNGFVAPSSQMEYSYKSIVGKLHAFGFIEVSAEGARNTRSASVDNLHRFSIESRTINELKAEVDRAIANDELLVFYGHSSRINISWNLQDLEELIDYCLQKEASGLARVDNVTNSVRFFYDLT